MSPLREALATAPGVIRAQRGAVNKLTAGTVIVLALVGYCLLVPLFALEGRTHD